MKKRILVTGLITSVVCLGGASQSLANQVIEGKDTNTGDITVRGNLGDVNDVDPTDPEAPIPEEDDRWISVTLPTTTVFEANSAQEQIISPDNYTITNESGRPVKVEVTSYTINSSSTGEKALEKLNIETTANSVTIYDNENINTPIGTHIIKEELVTLASIQGLLPGDTPGEASTNFKYTGTMDKEKINTSGTNYIDSTLKFTFTALSK